MARELLIEIGVEELPASFVRSGLQSMAAAAEQLLAGARLDGAEIQSLGTPRRLALRICGLPEQQSDRDETVMGPPWSVAFDDDGNPKPAAQGFAKKQGVTVAQLKKASTDKGDYVSADVHEPGAQTVDLLVELVPQICGAASFQKSMRWGQGEVAFGRPIHWFVALYGDEVIPCSFAGVPAGRQTRGHRFLAPDPFSLKNASEYEDALRAHHVIVDLVARRETMHGLLRNSAAALGAVLQEDAFLLDECVSLVEEPFVVPGTFDNAFLALPDSVVVSVMRDHQRYFALRDEHGALMPAYLNVVNTAGDPALIAAGNDRVLRARLADAKFFVEEDRKKPLEARLPKLDTVVFQTKLGSVGDKVRRIEKLTTLLAAQNNVPQPQARAAATLCKADLETLIVYEFPELQGEMGAWYARQEGLDDAVAAALREHYQPAGAEDAVAPSALGACVAVADRIDTLVGCFGIGLVPTGSADPFALRRAALGIVRSALEGPIDVSLDALIDAAYQSFEDTVALKPSDEVRAALHDFFRARIRAFAKSVFPGDVVDACLDAWPLGSVRDLQARLRAVSELRGRAEYAQLATAFKRASNISKEAPRGEVQPALLEAGAEQALARTFSEAQPRIESAASQQQYTDALRIIAGELGTPIDRFFEEVFVMVDDEAVRDNRLRLLGAIADTVNRIAHFHQLAP